MVGKQPEFETGELPPQGIGPEKSVHPNRISVVNLIKDTFIDRDLHPIVTVDPVADNALVVLRTGFRDGYDKHMGESLEWQIHFALRHLGVYDEKANLEVQLLIPLDLFDKENASQADEPKGVESDED